MTTATKEATKSREQELADVIAHHRGELAKIEAEAVALDQSAQENDADLDRLVHSFDRPAEGAAQDLRALQASAEEFRKGAALLRRRAAAYADMHKLPSLEVELAQLQTRRRDAEVRVAAEATHKAKLAEYYARCELLGELKDQVNQQFGRGRVLIDELLASTRQFGIDSPAGFDQELFDIANGKEGSSEWERRRRSETPTSREPLALLLDQIVSARKSKQ